MEYTTALYIRLSQEDENIGESDSVKNQRDLLTDFVANHKELSKSKILRFIDDGYSGTNFERPAVKDMLELVKKGMINCIVVKDFSRFGRNYIEVGEYLEEVFPFMGVRFLSVNDFFDSKNIIGSAVEIDVGFKTLLHDLYSKDLSLKSRTGKLAKIRKGEHVHSATPYGYMRSKTVKNAWEVDEAAAETVRKIFDFALQGYSVCDIARKLNNAGIASPLKHKMSNGTDKGAYCRRVDEVPIWRMANVSRILRDERYTGKLITGKKKRIAVGGRRTTPVPKSDWIIVPGAHAAIVSDETFNNVQTLLNPYNVRTLNRVNKNIFAGKLFCGHCRHALRRYDGLNPKYICQSSRETQNDKCLSDVIYEDTIKEVVLNVIKKEVSLALTGKKRTDRQSKLLLGEREKLSEQVKRLYSDAERLKHNRELLFEDYADGKITAEQYALCKKEKSDAIESKKAEISKISDELQKLSRSDANSKKSDRLKPFEDCNEVTPEMMALVSGIYVFDSIHIEITLNFFDERSRNA